MSTLCSIPSLIDIAYSITGSLFNPCITVSLMLLGILPPFRGLLYCVAQFLGSILASAILLGLTGTLSVKYAIL